ncbi:hypothetical protein [Nocardiopsis trehalosi]|uniref:hypothetical protein n=1 Tax=Nocardiopsis trehalosi TaxID=109329 RepID=UPI00082C1B55|nr:hypothetical protein [Nocardiopsis trehalosi]
MTAQAVADLLQAATTIVILTALIGLTWSLFSDPAAARRRDRATAALREELAYTRGRAEATRETLAILELIARGEHDQAAALAREHHANALARMGKK